jgi:tRNA pseudouridine38-40 synthase
MRNVKLTIEYDGRNFGGWQIQKNARTVQQVLREAIFKTTGEEVLVHGSGRTDSGVNARGQVASFLTENTLDAVTLQRAINSNLPQDVVVLSAEDVPENFHARYAATGKTYVYTIHNSETRTALDRRHQLFIPYALDLEKMRAAAKLFVGKHDFAAFGTNLDPEANTVRRIFSFEITRSGPTITMSVTGNGFIRNMVRSLVGTLIDVGRGKLSVADIEPIMLSRNRDLAGPTAPPCGLCLLKVFYDPIV